MDATATTIPLYFNCRLPCFMDTTATTIRLYFNCRLPCIMDATATTIGILSDNIEDPVLRQMMREEEEQKALELRIKVGGWVGVSDDDDDDCR